VHGFAGYAANGPIPTLDQILSGEKPSNSPPFRIDTLPGTLWRYSGGGYVVIRKALENVTGDSFAKLALQYVLAPAGMTHSSFEQPLSAAAMKSAAWPFGGDGQPLKEGAHVYPEVAPDGLWTTATDLAKLTIQVQQALNGAPNAILPQAMTREMLEPGGLAGWGLGWGLGGSAAAPYFWHSGSNAGYKSMLFAYRNGDGAIVMTNSDTGEKLASDIVRTIAYEYGWPDFRPLEIAPVALSTQQLDALTGRYRVGRFGLLAISRKDGRLFAQMPGESAFRIYPRSRTEWFADNPDGFFPNTSTQISFHAGEVVVRKNSADIVAPRLSDAQADKIARDLAARIAAKAPLPNSEKILRGYIAGMQSGTLDYAAMSPGAAWITRLILLNFARDIADLGALRAVTFQGVAPTGADNYAVTFEHGAAVAQIICTPDGKIEMVYLMSPTFM
jgi:hypothetical protein